MVLEIAWKLTRKIAVLKRSLRERCHARRDATLPVLQTSGGQYDEVAKASHHWLRHVKKSERICLSLVIGDHTF
jgi:hypothetical protein